MHVPISIGTEGAIRRSPLSLGTDGRLTVVVEIEKRGGGVKKKIFPKPRNRDEEVLLLIKVFLLCRS